MGLFGKGLGFNNFPIYSPESLSILVSFVEVISFSILSKGQKA
jgi:hypothetical protein